MKCQRCEELLSDYIDERLDAETAAEVAAHLAECRSCAGSESKLRATVALVGGLERKTAPLDFGELVAAKLERRMLLDDGESTTKRRGISPWRFAGIGVLAAAAILVVCYVMIPPVDEKGLALYDRVDTQALDKDFSGGAAGRIEETRGIPLQPAASGKAGEAAPGNEVASRRKRPADGDAAATAAAGGGRELETSRRAEAAPAPATLARTGNDAFSMPAIATEDDKATVTTLAPEEAAKLKSLGYLGAESEKETAGASAPVAVAVDSRLLSKNAQWRAESVAEADLSFFATEAVTIEFDGDVSAPVEKLMSLLGGEGIKSDMGRESLDELSRTEPQRAAQSEAGVQVAPKSLDELSKSASAAGVAIVEITSDRAVVEFECVPERAREITAALKQAFAPVVKAPADAKHVEGYVIEGPTTNQPAFDYGVKVDRDGDTKGEPTVTRLVFVRRTAESGEGSSQ